MDKPKVDRSINVPGTRGCCGCGVCVIVCPVANCITLSLDLDGYYIAAANRDTCINCGVCQDVCYMYLDEYVTEKNPDFFLPDQAIYTAYNQTEEIRQTTSSGGISPALCKAAIELGYTVIGAHLDIETKRLYHIVIDKIEELNRIRGSKYLPSYTVDAFMKLQKGGRFLIIGTPCQIGGLRQILNQPKFKRIFPNLSDDVILVEFRCSGHPGYNLFDKYVTYLHEFNPSGITAINMRKKKPSWFMGSTQVQFKEGNDYLMNNYQDPFFVCFRSDQAVHQTCLSCDIYRNQSVADIRLEDAWFFPPSPQDPTFKQGLSQVSIYSEKGRVLFDHAKKELTTTQVQLNLKQRPLNLAKNNGFLLALLRQDLGLMTIMSQFKKQAGPIKQFRWWWSQFAHTPLGKPIHETLKKYLPQSFKQLIKLFT